MYHFVVPKRTTGQLKRYVTSVFHVGVRLNPTRYPQNDVGYHTIALPFAGDFDAFTGAVIATKSGRCILVATLSCVMQKTSEFLLFQYKSYSYSSDEAWCKDERM